MFNHKLILIIRILNPEIILLIIEKVTHLINKLQTKIKKNAQKCKSKYLKKSMILILIRIRIFNKKENNNKICQNQNLFSMQIKRLHKYNNQ